MVSVKDVYEYLDGLAPFRLQMDFDNAGFLVGRSSRRARRAVSWFRASRRMALMAAAEMVRPGSTWARTSAQRKGVPPVL